MFHSEGTALRSLIEIGPFHLYLKRFVSDPSKVVVRCFRHLQSSKNSSLYVLMAGNREGLTPKTSYHHFRTAGLIFSPRTQSVQCSVVFLPGAPTNYVGLGTGANSWLRWKLVERTLQGHYIINITLTEILTLDTLWDWLNFIQVTSHQLPFVTLALAYCTAWQVGRGLQIGAPLSSAGDSQQDGDLDLQRPPILLSLPLA